MAIPVVIACDSDFAPAAKLAPQERIDFIFDPSPASIREDLHAHADEVPSVFRRPL